MLKILSDTVTLLIFSSEELADHPDLKAGWYWVRLDGLGFFIPNEDPSGPFDTRIFDTRIEAIDDSLKCCE
jgi:hypothetical protein